jgi:hypothetical protein
MAASKMVSQLAQQLYRFGETAGKNKLQLLQSLKREKHLTPSQIKDYRRCLLFVAAYPESKQEHEEATQGLKTLGKKIQTHALKVRKALKESGLPNTTLHGVYSYHLMHWLINQTDVELRLAFLEEGAVHPREALKSTFNEMEFELETDISLSPLQWLKKAFGCSKNEILLRRLLNHIENLHFTALQKDQVFESMRVCVALKCGEHLPVLALPTDPFLHNDGLLKKFDEHALIATPLPKASLLTGKQIKDIMACARLSLLYLNRETDPVSLCETTGIEYYKLERGLSIAFFSAAAHGRLPLESYIGFMMFKNAYPIAYGGAWLFGKRSLLGINIYESYRGGESAYLFTQLLRSYKQRFSPTYIEVEPYQFGKGNPEGIKTGAFWFYYRFGFKPVDKALRALAAKEFDKIKKNNGYRSPISVLKAFTHSNMMLRFEENFINLEPATLSAFITQTIQHRFEGNRTAFRKWALSEIKRELNIDFSRLSQNEKIGLEKLYGFISCCLDLSAMNKELKGDLKNLILEKGNSEFSYAEACERFPFEKFISPLHLRKQLGFTY